MTILHITNGGNYPVTTNFIRFVNENFNPQDHIFLIIDKQENVPVELSARANTRVIDVNQGRQFTAILSYMHKADLIILHSLCLAVYQQLFLLLFRPALMDKLVWVEWGMDLYQWRRPDKWKPLVKMRNMVALQIRQRFRYFVGLLPPDIEYFKKTFNPQAVTFYATYVGVLYNPVYEKEFNSSALAEKIKNQECINIQIGHSSSPILNHADVLNQLIKYKDENIKIYLPLSYGFMDYGDQIEQQAQQLWGEKAVCIRTKMSVEDYMDFLATIDIAIFNTPRQIGLGNVFPLLHMGKKLFMPAGSVMYEYLESRGIKIADYNQLSHMEFSRFIEPVDNAFKELARDYLAADNKDKIKAEKIEMWTQVFNAIKQ